MTTMHFLSVLFLSSLRARAMDRMDYDTHDLAELVALCDGEEISGNWAGYATKRLRTAEARVQAIQEWAEDRDFNLTTLRENE